MSVQMNLCKTVGTIVILAALSTTGCTTYYRVKDPVSGQTYYTTRIQKQDGATMLHDEKSGTEVTIQNSEVMKISKEEFESQAGKR